MRMLRRTATIGLSIAALVIVWLAPATPAVASGGLVYTVASVSANQEFVYCSNTPGPCTLEGHNQLYTTVSLNTSHTSSTVHYQLIDGTAKVGIDFYGPATGTVTISSTPVGVAPEVGLIDVPLMITGATVSKTFTIKLTSASPTGDITSIGTETILPGNEIPSDCVLSYVNGTTKTLACTGRPATQHWYLHMECIEGFTGGSTNGNTVTGNGTSTATCPPRFEHAEASGLFVVA